ncbi:PAS domain-containing protein [Peribacillus cavernae]|uniref:histidine kinase n=1 Tax=Peribacillus cavernae TaxID=1674310 RepID=A0A433HC58_9BACI|nr:ATP-binding protein [Peribacillus cavernae]MDQ0219713.1 PAS domain S-box-containing protein [Peribacillus cavernae]RUQ25990.1 PAS domain-containing protein [Peribacillus cavernae]
MNEQLEYIGNKIKQGSHFLAQKLSNILTVEIDPSLFIPFEDQPIDWLELYFQSIGDSLCSGEIAERNILLCADIFGRRAVDSEIPPDKSMDLFVHSRTVILDFLLIEIDGIKLSTKTILLATKTINQLIDKASSAFISHYQKSLSIAKYALAESSEDLKITLKELNDLKNALNETTIFAITDKNDNITYANDKFCDITKYTKEEIIGQNHNVLFSGYHPEEFFEKVRETIRQGKVWKGEIMNKAKDGTTYWVDSTLIPFSDRNGETYQHISIQNDITEQKFTEELLQKTEKLSLVGELAAGIAHEIRNPLTTIKGFVQLLSQALENGDLPYSSIILGEIDRINFIVSEFMVFAKPHTIYYNKCNVSEILYSVISLLGAEASLKNVRITNRFLSENPYIFGEKNQLKQVFLNMLKNAIEALPDGGNIQISLSSEEQDIQVLIADDGIGMSLDQIQKLGEPFYTTKETGTGLGLMVSYKIIQNHKGSIHVKSNVDGGTTFTIVFPMLAEKDHAENIQ